MWVYNTDAPVGCRYNKDVFHGITSYRSNQEVECLWFEHSSRKFKPYDECVGSTSSHGHGINSLRAFKRYVNKHCGHMKHYEIVLCSRVWLDIGGKVYDTSITATWVDTEQENK